MRAIFVADHSAVFAVFGSGARVGDVHERRRARHETSWHPARTVFFSSVRGGGVLCMYYGTPRGNTVAPWCSWCAVSPRAEETECSFRLTNWQPRSSTHHQHFDSPPPEPMRRQSSDALLVLRLPAGLRHARPSAARRRIASLRPLPRVLAAPRGQRRQPLHAVRRRQRSAAPPLELRQH